MEDRLGSNRLVAQKIIEQFLLIFAQEALNPLPETLLQLEDTITVLLSGQVLCLFGVGSRVCLQERFVEGHKEYENFRGKGATVIETDKIYRLLSWDDEPGSACWVGKYHLAPYRSPVEKQVTGGRTIMNYKIHDTTCYGIYNGPDASDIQAYTEKAAKELGLTYLDYEVDDVQTQLRKDEELQRLAQQTYTPYPVNERWGEEYKRGYLKQIAERTAPGDADIPDELIYQKIDAILDRLAKRILPARQAEQEAEQKERNRIMSKIDSVKTTEEVIEDEGGRTIMYHHCVTMKSGVVLNYTDRNIFDFGRTVNPSYPVKDGLEPGGVINLQADGTFLWMYPTKGRGFVSVRPLTEDETYAFLAISKYYGHCRSAIRM